MKLRTSLIYILVSLICISLGWWGSEKYFSYLDGIPAQGWSTLGGKPKPLEKYTIENLAQTEVKPAVITIEDNIFKFEFDPTLEYKKESNLKTVTGLINIPEKETKAPIVILLRGYVDQSIYQTGVGTKRVGEYFAENGYITLAPDFLGYGGSSVESSNIFETRFQTYTTILTLLQSIEDPNSALRAPLGKWDGENIFIWAHSNGGQIALTVLEATGKNYPTVLWAPVTESFPYSIIYYTNESEDGGKFIRKELAKFEADYDTDKFSLTKYLDRINAPIQYHLGTSDDAIPLEWGERFVKRMKSLEKEVINYNHSGADHNMNPLWSEVMQQTLLFFAKQKN